MMAEELLSPTLCMIPCIKISETSVDHHGRQSSFRGKHAQYKAKTLLVAYSYAPSYKHCLISVVRSGSSEKQSLK